MHLLCHLMAGPGPPSSYLSIHHWVGDSAACAHRVFGCLASVRPSCVWRNGRCVRPAEPCLSLQKPKHPDMCFPSLCGSASLSDDPIRDTSLGGPQGKAEVPQTSWDHSVVAPGSSSAGCQWPRVKSAEAALIAASF